jgi:hypothetical protein
MATTFRKGQDVEVNAFVPHGPVQALRMEEDGTIMYLVKWTDLEGSEHERWFAENELTATGA